MKTFFLAAAIVGAIVPWVLFLQYIGVNGLDFIAFADAVFANLAAGAFAADLLLSSVFFWAFMIHRSRIRISASSRDIFRLRCRSCSATRRRVSSKPSGPA